MLIKDGGIMNFGDLLRSERKDYFYIMHLSYGTNKAERERLWNYAIDKKMIGLDLPDIVRKAWTTLSEPEKQAVSKRWKRQFDLFCVKMKTGDYVVVLDGWFSLLGIAQITKPEYKYDKKLSGKEGTGFFDHVREDVIWKLKYKYDGLRLDPPIKGFDNTLSPVTPRSPRWEILTRIRLP